MNESPGNAQPSQESQVLKDTASSAPPSRKALWLLLAFSLAAVAGVLWLVLRPDVIETETIESILEGDAAREAGVYRHEVLDAIQNRDLKAALGRRYKVRFEDESREGAAGVAKIGGLVTFVTGARKGEIAIVEVTRVKRSVAEAVRVKGLEKGPEPAVTSAAPATEDPSDPVRVGGVYSGTADELGRDGDGIIRVSGKVVFVEGARVGEAVRFEVTDNLGRFARGRVVGAADPAEAAPSARPRERRAKDAGPDPVRVGGVYSGTAAELGREGDGIIRVAGKVVFVEGARVGEAVQFEVTENLGRFARGRVIGAAAPEGGP